MKLYILFALFCLLIPETAFAELSMTNQWRIEQADHRCRLTNNDITYTEYWGDAVTEDNKETICMAEHFANLVMMDGDAWLEKQGVELIQQCKEVTKKDKNKYFLCLQKNLVQFIKILSSPCRELGVEKLWEEKMCRRLVSFIFIQRFEELLEVSKTPVEKIGAWIDRIGNIGAVRILFNPVMAVLWLIVFILDMMLLIDRGNWTRVPRLGIIIGSIILVSCYVKGGLRYFSAGIAIFIMVAVIVWNHLQLKFKIDKKK